MTDRTPKKLHSFRLDPDLVARADAYASEVGVNRTALVEALLEALCKGRLWVVPDKRPNPFPGVTRPEVLPVKPFEGVQPGTYPHRSEEKSDAC
jgi:hypothetical protein